MRKHKNLLITIIFLFMVYAIYFFGIPAIFNATKNTDFIEELFQKRAGLTVKIDNPKIKMGVLPSLWIYTDELKLFSSDGSMALNIKNPKIKISFMRLLLGKINLSYFSASDIFANIIYDSDNNLYLGDYLIPKSLNNSILYLNNTKLKIYNYNLFFNDKTINQTVKINGDKFIIHKFIKNRHFKSDLDLNVIANNNISTIQYSVNLKLPIRKNLSNKNSYIKVSISNLYIDIFSKYLSYFTNYEYKDLKGQLNLSLDTKSFNSEDIEYLLDLSLEKFGINGKKFAIPYYYEDKLKIKSIFLARKHDLYISNANIKGHQVNLNTEGVINKIHRKCKFINFRISTKNSRAEGIVQLLPANNNYFTSTNLDIETLVKSGFFADVNFDLNIIGKITRPDVFGYLSITNAYVTKNPIPNNTKKATINMNFIGDKIHLEKVHVPASLTDYVDVLGWIELYDKKNIDITITSSKNVDLAVAQYVLLPVHKILRFELGPVPFMDIKGTGNIVLRVTGNKVNPHAFGIFKFKNSTVVFKDIKNMIISNASGTLKFDDTHTFFKSDYATLNDKPIHVNGTCDLFGNLDFDIISNKQKIVNFTKILNSSPMLSDISNLITNFDTTSGYADLKLNLTGTVKNLEDIVFGKNIFANGNIKLYGVTAKINKILIPITNISGNIDFNNTDLKLNLESVIKSSKITIKGNVKNNLSDINIKSSNMRADDVLSTFSNGELIPINMYRYGRRGLISFNAHYQGAIDKIDFSKLKVDGSFILNNFDCIYKKYNIPINLNNVNMNIRNNTLNVYTLNINIAGMPVYLKGTINDIYKNPNFDIYTNLKPNQQIVDILYNKFALYPIKIKGNISSAIFINGHKDSYSLKSTVTVDANSKIYYMGATIGDEINSTILNIDSHIKKDYLYIKNLTLDKIMNTNRNRLYPVRELLISGGLNYTNNNIYFNNFKVKTISPIDSKFLNIIFKKPYIKQGIFSSDIKVSGSLLEPKIIGYLNIKDIDIPKYFTHLSDCKLTFDNNNIDLVSSGSIFDSDFKITSNMENKLIEPYKINNVKLYINDINLNKISNDVKQIELDEHEKLTIKPIINFTNVIINNAQLFVKNIFINDIKLHDLKANASYNKNKIFNLENFIFQTASGEISGNFTTNLNNHKHTIAVNLMNIDAKSFSETLFRLHNQISGNLNGDMKVTCQGLSQEECLKTLSGSAGFTIKNGNMPKLGSMEYFLKAANLVKSGITGLSINGLIELISPLRTGEFDIITGTISIKNGNCDSIQIYSHGKNLNLFINGKYNLTTSMAQMKVFGRLARNSSNILGAVGNASLNALLNTLPLIDLSTNHDSTILEYINKIPAIELNSKKYRIFTVDINGDINSDNYVKSFNWVE